MQMHTFGHAPSRQIMVRASPDEPYLAVSPRAQSAVPPPAGLPRGVQQLPAVDPSPTKLVHYDKGSGMWLTDPAGVAVTGEGSQEPGGPHLGTGLPSAISPGQCTGNSCPLNISWSRLLEFMHYRDRFHDVGRLHAGLCWHG